MKWLRCARVWMVPEGHAHWYSPEASAVQLADALSPTQHQLLMHA
jgi:hypothetical protein